MLARILQTPILERSRSHERRRHATVLPAAWSRSAKPTAADYMAAYPCTRMHGAAFEAEFYPDRDEPL